MGFDYVRRYYPMVTHFEGRWYWIGSLLYCSDNCYHCHYYYHGNFDVKSFNLTIKLRWFRSSDTAVSTDIACRHYFKSLRRKCTVNWFNYDSLLFQWVNSRVVVRISLYFRGRFEFVLVFPFSRAFSLAIRSVNSKMAA